MMGRRWLLELSVLTVSCMVVLVPSASAKSGREHLLPLKACNQVMTGADFDDGLEQVAHTSTFAAHGQSGESSVCLYASLEADAPGPHMALPEPPPVSMVNPLEPPPTVPTDCIANGLRLFPTTTPPPTGCYSYVTTVVGITEGSRAEALLRHKAKYPDKGHWPAGLTRTVLRSFGSDADAELGYGKGESGEALAYGYLQLKNAQITIEEKTTPPTTPRAMLTLLDDAKSTL